MMEKAIRNNALWIVGFAFLVFGVTVASQFYRTPSTEELRSLGYYRFEEPRQIGSFSLVNQESNPVDRSAITGHWSLIFFGFTYCPDICPTTMSVLNAAVKETPEPPQVIMVSVDPERDTPEVLGRYVTSFNKGFHGYTGTIEDITGLATQLNVAFGKVPGHELGTYSVEHGASIVVINPRGEYAGFIKAPHRAQNIAAIIDGF
ncbi:MAG TPA: SCO family protein [Gammaproteobacteria bacterium]|nr:SCO family protein [Gammaproteobacteria bacterium]|tara:strand:- start:1795 stop:2406 length:612 start_codon:yes stop_codon:yes gene_type:complete